MSLAGTLEGMRGRAAGQEPAGQAVRAGQLEHHRPASIPIGDFDAGFDVKYGVTTGLTWDFTVNTDFSQVEADEQQINLTRFSLFFPEKRDFFLENSGIFQFGGGGGGGGRGRRRRPAERVAGHAAVLQPADRAVRCRATAIPILAGTRLTGRQGAYSIGALNIQQREQGPVARRRISRRCACAATSSRTPTSAPCS